MITASDAWKDIQQRFILPEGFLEIICAITENGLQETVSARGSDEAFVSNVANAINTSATDVEKYAATELNIWALDGSFSIAPDSAPYGAGYVSNTDGFGSIVLTLPEVHTEPIPGVTITWGSEHDEYPTAFTVTARNTTLESDEIELLGNTTVGFVSELALVSGINASAITVGTLYNVYWNGQKYECVAQTNSLGNVYLGNRSLIGGGTDTGEPFVFEMLTANSAYVTKSTRDHEQVSLRVTTKDYSIVGEVSVTNNTDRVSVVDMELSGYNSVTITVWEWCIPNRRVRIEKAALGHILSMGKNDILSYTHEQHGDLNSGELPKNSIQFSLDNIDGRWNPSNPVGLERYLSERQKITARYGMDVNGVVEWVDAGVFYLSEWRAPANGLEANFVARDVFEYLLNTPYTGITSGTLKTLAAAAFEVADIPADVVIVLDDHLSEYSAVIPETEGHTYTCAEVVQMCANAASCVIRQDRSGTVYVERLNPADSGYLIPSALSYAHPELELSKQLKSVSVAYGNALNHVLSVGGTGETQTVSNPLISTQTQAAEVATWVRDTLETRRSIRGEYRADPRLDLFDVVRVESKYGMIAPVAITNISYTYNGAFAGSYTGRVISEVGYRARSGN